VSGIAEVGDRQSSDRGKDDERHRKTACCSGLCVVVQEVEYEVPKYQPHSASHFKFSQTSQITDLESLVLQTTPSKEMMFDERVSGEF
jgi:hypothetical protein